MNEDIVDLCVTESNTEQHVKICSAMMDIDRALRQYDAPIAISALFNFAAQNMVHNGYTKDEIVMAMGHTVECYTRQFKQE